MSYNSNITDKNIKENFLEKQENNNNENLIEKIEIVTNTYPKIENEKYGMLIAALSVLIGSCQQIYTKIIQKTFPEDFRTVQFLFLRSFTLFFLAIFHSYIMKEKIMRLRDIPSKKWFFMRTNANFFGVACMTLALWYLRASTTVIIQNIHPLIVLLMSFLVLKEKFYMRYIYGIIICFLGVLITVLNESKIKVNNTIEVTTAGRNIGLFFCCIDLFFISSVRVANKIMVNKKVPITTQMCYVSLCTMTYSSIYTLIFGGLCLKFGFLIIFIFEIFLYNIKFPKFERIKRVNVFIPGCFKLFF
jgi:drug/metabolite transporter (DMT)-like permease